MQASEEIRDSQLYAHAARSKDKVVLITGAANGIGRRSALAFAQHGCVPSLLLTSKSVLTSEVCNNRAKIVIGDLNVAGGIALVEEVEKIGG